MLPLEQGTVYHTAQPFINGLYSVTIKERLTSTDSRFNSQQFVFIIKVSKVNFTTMSITHISWDINSWFYMLASL
jgi:hypothetical protein